MLFLVLDKAPKIPDTPASGSVPQPGPRPPQLAAGRRTSLAAPGAGSKPLENARFHADVAQKCTCSWLFHAVFYTFQLAFHGFPYRFWVGEAPHGLFLAVTGDR